MIITELTNHYDIERACIALGELRPFVSDLLSEMKQREVGC